MDCDTCREALSARLDGEPTSVSLASSNEHVGACAACQEWAAAATALAREFEDESPGPDLAAAVLGQVSPRTGLLGGTRWRRAR